MAIEKFEAVVENVAGLKVSCKSRDFEFILDEPKNLGGTDTGMNPVEALLNSLGACKVIVAKSFARLHKIKLKSIRIELEGELDPDGFMGKNPNAKIGFSKITTNFFIEADNTDEEIGNFVDFINRTCPVADTIENGPEMVSNIIK
ncbi:OsmC family protein [Vagococcus carniphilus]|uniref:OsmC family protein n=1 Tax=Vagococcus carniphilus TaxID=218144 RepID=A0AAW8U1Z5_9ENTE|nr:OsmC family protein [Vagococcus carniphilus]MDT2831533.1 OsmC family protein [Vagococcus carniphilus]MDT2832816.1 OsmC family protein [Vagococcus carniphilus]MDT2840255.1 OsmC family protein [Vagococcus carniphilus]MDT2854922.1 OsmC family protein [Vagococcus carniphilus]